MGKLKRYKVRYSNYSYCTVNAQNKLNARKRAWSLIAGKGVWKYGWTKQDFLKNASVEEL